MGFTVTFRLNNPYPAGSPITFEYDAHNDGPDEPVGHLDQVQVWGISSKPLDVMISAFATVTGETYTTPVEVDPLPAGHYDVSVTIPSSAGAGTTIIVQ